MALTDRDEHCPERGVGLTHIQDGEVACVYCGTRVAKARGTAQAREPETRAERRAEREELESVDFTDDQVNHLEFLRWLRREGRV